MSICVADGDDDDDDFAVCAAGLFCCDVNQSINQFNSRLAARWPNSK